MHTARGTRPGFGVVGWFDNGSNELVCYGPGALRRHAFRLMSSAGRNWRDEQIPAVANSIAQQPSKWIINEQERRKQVDTPCSIKEGTSCMSKLANHYDGLVRFSSPDRPDNGWRRKRAPDSLLQ